VKKLIILILCLFITPVFSQTVTVKDLYTSAISDYETGFFKSRRVRISKKYLIKAKETFNNIISQFPSTEEAQLSLYKIGFCHYKLKDYASAITTLTEYLNKYQNDTLFLTDEALHQLGLSYLLQKDYVNAEAKFNAVVQLKTQTETNLKDMIPESYYQLWQLYRSQNNSVKANGIYQSLQAEYPDHKKTKYIANILKNESK
jgi:TolA-binding protein